MSHELMSKCKDFCEPFIGKFSPEYRNVPKFSDRQVWANSVDPDQTASRGASTLLAILSTSFGPIHM